MKLLNTLYFTGSKLSFEVYCIEWADDKTEERFKGYFNKGDKIHIMFKKQNIVLDKLLRSLPFKYETVSLSEIGKKEKVQFLYTEPDRYGTVCMVCTEGNKDLFSIAPVASIYNKLKLIIDDGYRGLIPVNIEYISNSIALYKKKNGLGMHQARVILSKDKCECEYEKFIQWCKMNKQAYLIVDDDTFFVRRLIERFNINHNEVFMYEFGK